MRTAAGSAHARIALAGNPSDGFGGATLATVVTDFGARVTASESARDDFDDPARALLAATARRFRREFGGGAVALRCATDVPREVGLGGSSAIVIAALRALCELRGVALEPDALAARALAVETEELGIEAGPQDRVVQSYDGLVAMDFASGRHEPLDPELLPPLFLAYRVAGGAPSGGFHGDLRARFDAGDAAVRDGMAELAQLARAARDALLARDHERLARCIDGSFDVRERIAGAALDPRDVALVRTARSAGACANYAGSGGAVAGICPAGALDALARAFEAQGCALRRVSPAAPARRRSS